MSSLWKPRTVVQAIEEAATSTQTGYRFVDEDSGAEPESSEPLLVSAVPCSRSAWSKAIAWR
jgi:hypothetical protein